MLEWIHNIRASIARWLGGIGLDPLYIIPSLIIIYALSLWRDYYNWRDMSKEDKSWLVSVLWIFLASILILVVRIWDSY